MTITIVPYGSGKILDCVTRIFDSNTEYNSDDIKWLINVFTKNYNYLGQNPNKYYSLLTLVNMRIFSGYFAHIFNYKLTKYTKERNEQEITKLFFNPEFKEVLDNNILSEDEKNELLKIFEMEVYTTNLFMKKISINTNLTERFDEVFEECYIDVYTKIFRNDVKNPKNEFQDFILVTEYNPRTKTNHAYTFKLIDLLIQCFNQNFTHKLSDITIKSLCDKFETELKIIEYNMQILATI